jgi:hypothetical protein
MATHGYVIMKLECEFCKTSQKVHVAARTGFAQMGHQIVRCIKCNGFIRVTVPDKIVDGPFPA